MSIQIIDNDQNRYDINDESCFINLPSTFIYDNISLRSI